MSSDEEYESFQVTEEDLFGSRKRRKFTKEDHIYGLWAQHNSDEEDGGGGRSRNKDYSMPVNFVSAGPQTLDEPDQEGAESGDEDLDAEAERIMEQRDQRKISRGGAKSGVGAFRHAALERNQKLGMFEGSLQPQQGSLQPQQGSLPPQQTSKPTSSAKKPNIKTFRDDPSQVAPDRDFGNWQKYGSGFGSKMLQKMGWKIGKGLGTGGEGIVNPVKASRHTEFGWGKNEPRRSAVVGVSMAEDSEDEEDEAEFQQQLQQWRKPDGTGGAAKGKPKYVYKTVEELKSSGKRVSMKEKKARSTVKVIDMTGKQRRVLSGYGEIHGRHSRPDEATPSAARTAASEQQTLLPELMHNVQMLVDTAETEILRSDRSLQHNHDLIINLSHEQESLTEEVAVEKRHIDKLTEILTTIETLEQRLVSVHSPPLTLSECEELMLSLQEKYPSEYKVYQLSSVAVAFVFPLIKGYLKSWDLFGSPKEPLHVFSTWKGLLRERQDSRVIPDSDNMDPYDRLVWEVWMPRLRQTLAAWSPRHCSPLVDLLEVWMPLLPEWVMTNVLDQVVMPRLQSEVEAWDPTTDTVPIHSWIHPWLPLMENRLELLFAPIRYKLATALNSWHPSDSSAHKILEPWVKVFSPETMEAFIARTILPKLTFCLQTLPINPHNQDIAPFKWVMAWRDMTPPHHYAAMLDKHFFPKWLQVLTTWLGNGPNYEEVTKWYMGWKSMLDTDILSDPAVKRHLGRALDLMNHAVSGTFQPGVRENMAYFTSTERRKTAEVFSTQRGRALHNAVSAPTSVSFKDVIERMAEDSGVLFMPVPGQKRYEGKALYNYGRAIVYIDRGVVFAMKQSQWTPVSLDELKRLAD